MGNPNGFRTVLLIAPPMILVWGFAALIFILDRVSQGLLYSQGESNWRRGGREITLYGPTNDTSTEYDYIDVYLSVDNSTILATLLVCIIAYFVAAIGTCAVWELRRVEGTASHQRKWSWFTIVANVILAGASFGVFGWASSVQANGKRWHSYEDVGNNFRSYTKETWACQINEYFPKQNWAGQTCSVAKATRFMLLPLGISALLVIVCILILARDRGGFKWLIGGKGRYGGFENIYEMQPPTPGGPIMVRPMPQPMPQWRPQPMPQWAPQHIPQPILHPALQPKQQPPPQTQQPGAAYQGPVTYR